MVDSKQLAELFRRAKGTVSEHINHIFEDVELDENSVVRFFRTTAADGKQYVDRMVKVASLPAVSLSGNSGKGYPTTGRIALQIYLHRNTRSHFFRLSTFDLSSRSRTSQISQELKQRLYALPEASSSTWRTLWEASRFGAAFRVGAIFNMRFFLIDRAMIKITFRIKIVPAVQ